MIVNTLRRVGRGLPSVRLLIEYMMIGALVALVAHAVLAWSERSQLAQRAAQLEGQLAAVESTLDAQVAMNRDQDAAIARLRALRDRQAGDCGAAYGFESDHGARPCVASAHHASGALS
ncbi:hypothetical protein MRX58_04515 [Xylella fastidiosa subsp. pauca]|nr:hypothetical protein [Xylella fastidiosa]MDG5822839.1 hypothetical protein [Xylella fastidiosa subsp. pauca]